MGHQTDSHRGDAPAPSGACCEELLSSQSEDPYQEVFEDCPIVIWIENWSRTKAMINRLARRGVKDWQRYFERRPDQLIKAYDLCEVVDVNQAALRIYRASSKEEVIATASGTEISTEELATFREQLIAFVKGATSYDTDAKERALDNSEIFTRTHTVIPDGHCDDWSRVIFTMEDITERKRTEMALRESEERFRDISMASSDWFWEMDENLRYTFVSLRGEGEAQDEAKRMIGRTREEVGAADNDPEKWQAHRTLLEAREPFRDFHYKKYVNGNALHLSVSGVPIFDEHGEFRGYRGSATNITERVEAEAAQHESEARLTQAVSLAKIGLWDWDEIEDKAIYCSDELAEMYGVASGDELATMLSSHAADLSMVHPEDMELFDEAVRTSKGLNCGYDIEFRIINRAGEIRHVHGIEELVRNERGEVIRSTGVTQDITEQKQAEEALRLSEQSLANAQRMAHLGNWDWTIASDDLYMSDEAFRIYGYEAQAFPATLDTCLQAIHPDDRDRVSDAVDQATSSGQRFANEFRILRPDGTLRYVYEQAEVIYSDDGAPVRMSGTVHDITERKLAEEALEESNARAVVAHARLNNAIESISQGFALYDADDRLVLCNDRYRDLLYPGKKKQVKVGMTFEEIIRNAIDRGLIKDAEGDTEAWIASRLAQHRIPDGTQLQQRGSGQWVQITERGTDEGGIVAIYGDVTKLKNAERELLSANQFLDNQSRELEEMTQDLIQARDQAELANRAKSEFLANMSHELRTPLNAVIGFSEMISNEMFGPVGASKYLEYAKDINGSGEHLLDLINDILDISKIEAGKTELCEENIDVSRVFRSCLTLVKERAKEAGIEIECDITSNLPTLYVDERKFKQILINLLSNAIKFTPPGGRVTVRTWSRMDDGYVFQIADTGIGIALADIPKALAPFQQIDSDLNRKYEGTGLGLPLSKALVESHGGSLGLRSEVDVGTTVTVRFPAERIVSAAKQDAANAAE